MSAGSYQLSARASKGNAFCWLTYDSGINWTANVQQEAAQQRRNEGIERRRAEGVDPLHIGGMGARIDLDPRRFLIYNRARTEEVAHGARSETLRQALQKLGPQSAGDLARLSGLHHSSLVGALLRYDIKKKRVTFIDGQYSWVGT